MAFSVPQMPLSCDVYSGPWLTKSLRFSVDCNLQFSRRAHSFAEGDTTDTLLRNGPVYLLVPALTDLRDRSCNIAHSDIVEVPSGSGRWYGIIFVDDVGKGFDNEYRLAVLLKISQNLDPVLYAGLFWPIPIT